MTLRKTKGGDRTMRIVVLVKQVPSTDKVKMDVETGIMVRSATEAELNPLDTYAVEEAVRVKEKTEGTEITVISMGPPMATYAIREALSLIHISEPTRLGMISYAVFCLKKKNKPKKKNTQTPKK